MAVFLRALFIALFGLAQIIPSTALAANTSSIAPIAGFGAAAAPKPEGLSSCFDHYRFGSVQAKMSPTLAGTVPGANISFTGTIQNTNPYPIVDAVVYAKIFRSRGTEKNINGNDAVAFFAASKPTNLKAHESKPVQFTWTVPPDAEPGDYLLATDVVSSDRFELSGLVFTDDIVGSMANFKVDGQDRGAVRFDKDSVIVNGQPFYFAAFPPQIPAGAGAVPVTAHVKNSTAAPFKGTVTWNVYYWDSIGVTHLLDTQKQEVKAHASSSAEVGLTVTDTAHSVYYILGTLKTEQGSESTVGIRFARGGVNEPRFSFVTVDQGTAVACIHSTGQAAADKGHVELSVFGNSWWRKLLKLFGMGTLAHATYDGQIPGDLYALTAPLKHTDSSYTVVTDLSQNGKHIDTITLNYSCADLGTSCSNSSTLISIVVALLALIVLVLLLKRSRKPKSSPEHVMPPL